MLFIGSRKFDYMRDPLDFCLYSTDIISRFVGQYVIVYATDGEGDKFVQAFKDFFVDVEYVANLKYTSGRFDCDPPITIRKKIIKDLDQLVSMRRGEPIIVQSHKRWVELVAKLESKGLELGKDIFFWEQGYPRTKLISKFIEHNEKIWKSEKIESTRKVLIPYSVLTSTELISKSGRQISMRSPNIRSRSCSKRWTAVKLTFSTRTMRRLSKQSWKQSV